MNPRKIPRRLIAVLTFSAVAGMAVAAMLTMIVMRHGTHANYCPAASAAWILRCIPTADAVLMFGWVSLMAGLPVLLFLMLLLGVGRR